MTECDPPPLRVGQLDALASAALDGALAAIRDGDLEQALEWLEHHRAVRAKVNSRVDEVLAELEVGLDRGGS